MIGMSWSEWAREVFGTTRDIPTPPPRPAPPLVVKKPPKIPAQMECPDCGMLVQVVRNKFALHSEWQLGPQCGRAGEQVNDKDLAYHANRERMKLVLHWAYVLRDEDPSLVHRWMAGKDRAELEALLLTALAGIQPTKNVGHTYGWLRGLGA